MSLTVPSPRSVRATAFATAVFVLSAALSWTALALIARGRLPVDQGRLFPLFIATLIWTYIVAWLTAIALSNSRRRMLVRALGTTVALAIGSAVLEVPAAVGWVNWGSVLRMLSGEGVDYRSAYVPDAQLSFRRIPGLHWSGRPASDIEEAYGLPPTLAQPITFSYDRWGYRNRVDLDQADVVLIGDSMVEGWYVSDDDTVASQLAAQTGRRVANLGVAGYGPLQELRVLQDDAMRRHPKVVAWFFFEGNDLYDDQRFEDTLLAEASDQRGASERALARVRGWPQRSFVLNTLHRLRRLSDPIVPAQAPYWATLATAQANERYYFFRYGEIPWTPYEEQRWATARRVFEQGLAFARERGIAMVFVYAPIKYRVFRQFLAIPPGSAIEHWDVWHALPGHFAAFCHEKNVPCVDLTDALRSSVGRGRPTYPPTDTHWNAHGHAIAATALADVLRVQGW